MNWIEKNKNSLIRSAFLIPILAVAAISISHVVSWYGLANPVSWAIYLSVAVEIAAMSAIAAASVRVKGFSVWFVFIIVTLIQFIGNIYFSYSHIDVASTSFKDWSDLTTPIIESMGSDISDLIAQRRLLSILEGGLLPLISLTCLHFFISYESREEVKPTPDSQYIPEETQSQPDPVVESEPITELAEPVEEVADPEPKKGLDYTRLSHTMKKIFNND